MPCNCSVLCFVTYLHSILLLSSCFLHAYSVCPLFDLSFLHTSAQILQFTGSLPSTSPETCVSENMFRKEGNVRKTESCIEQRDREGHDWVSESYSERKWQWFCKPFYSWRLLFQIFDRCVYRTHYDPMTSILEGHLTPWPCLIDP